MLTNVYNSITTRFSIRISVHMTTNTDSYIEIQECYVASLKNVYFQAQKLLLNVD